MAKKSKYADVVKDLPKMPGVDPSRQDAVNVVRGQIVEPWKTNEPEPQRFEGLLDDDVKSLIESTKRYAALKGQITAPALAAAYAQCRELRDRIKEWDSAIGLVIEAYQWLMVEQFKAEGVNGVRLANGQLVSTWEEPYPTVVDAAALREWAMADPDLSRKLQLHFGTLSAIVKDRLLQGEPEPPGVEVKALTKVRVGGGDGE